MLDILITIIALITLIIATISDIKTKEIPDYLNYSVIAISLFIYLIYSILTSNYLLILYALIALIIMYALGSLMAYARLWGGGDTKLLVALSVLFSNKIQIFEFTKLGTLPYVITFIFNILIAGSIYSIIYIIVLAIKNRKEFAKTYKDISRNSRIWIFKIIVFIFSLTLIISSMYFKEMLFSILALFIILYFYIFLLAKIIEKICMLKLIPIAKLVEGDWIAKQVEYKNKILASPKDIYITKKQIELLKKYKIKKVWIKDGIAFAPAFLIGTIITLTLGNLVLWII